MVSFRFTYSDVLQIMVAGLPVTTESSGISVLTTLPAPIITLFPIVTPGRIMLPLPIKTLFPIVILPILV